MNSNEMPQSTDKTAITVIQILENSQPQVLTHEYLYTSVIKEAKYDLDLILFQIKWIKPTQYQKESFKRNLRKNQFFPISMCNPKNGVGSRDQKMKTCFCFFLFVEMVLIFPQFGKYSSLNACKQSYFLHTNFFNCITMFELKRIFFA